jgi:hypothetical protein
MAGVKKGDRLASQTQRAGAYVQQVMMRCKPLGLKQRHFGATGFIPASTDDGAVTAFGKGFGVKTGFVIG